MKDKFEEALANEEIEVQRLIVVDVVCQYLRYNNFTLKYEICEADLANDMRLIDFVNAVHKCSMARR